MAGQLPFVLDKQKGPALPLWTGVTLEMLLTKLKAAAENQTPMGLKMNSLDFIVTLGDETLTMRDATAKCIYRKHGMAVPESLKDVVVTNFLGRLRRAPSARAFGPGLRPLLLSPMQLLAPGLYAKK